MEWQQVITDIYTRVSRELERALDGLTAEDLSQQPHPDSNSIGWLVWHLTRMQDWATEEITGEQQLWIKDDWYARFNRPPDPTDKGLGHSSEDVAAFRVPDIETLLEYNRAVIARSKSYASSRLSEPELDREFDNPTYPVYNTVHKLLVVSTSGALQHVGQVAYLQGLLKGKGWSNI